MSARNARFLAAFAVFALVTCGLVIRLRVLLASPYPLGIDGYWYAIQLRSLLETGRLHYPSAPLVPWLMTPLAWLSDPIFGAKLGAALGTALAVIPTYVLAKRMTGDRRAALVGAAFLATSNESVYLATEYVKEGIGITVALWFIAELEAARKLHALVFFAGAILAHKTAVALALLVGTPMLLHSAPEGGLRLRIAACVGLALLAWSIVGPGDFTLVTRMFGPASWALPVLAVPGRAYLYFGHEVLLAALLAIVLGALWCTQRFPRMPPVTHGVPLCTQRCPRMPPVAMGFLAFALFLGIPWLRPEDGQGLAFRLRLMAFATVPPLGALALARLWRRFGRARTPLAVGLGLVLLARAPGERPEGVVITHPALVAGVKALVGKVPAGATVVTPERHVAFMATWYARVSVRLRSPTDEEKVRLGPPTDEEVFRLLPGASIEPELWHALGELRAHPQRDVAPTIDLHPWHPNGLVLMTEATFRYLIGTLSPGVREKYERWWIL